jgi:hypothetical protein
MRPLLSLILLCLLAAPAAADGAYFTESLGSSHAKGQLGAGPGGAVKGRIAVGGRIGSWALELWGGVYVDLGAAGTRDAPPCDCALRTDAPPREGSSSTESTALAGYGLDLKYVHPLIDRHLELYLRGGASRLAGEVQGDAYAGRGLGIGTGLQLKGKIPALGFLFFPLFFTDLGPKVTAAVWADTGTEFYRLQPGRPGRPAPGGPTIDTQLSTLSFGIALGSDF